MPPGSRIALVESWIAHVQSSGLDVTFGMEVGVTDELTTRERYYMGLERFGKDKVAAAALLHATRRLAARRGPAKKARPALQR